MRVILYTGKGGTGKSVLAAATAVQVAARGQRTLLLSADHAHTIPLLLGAAVEPVPTAITPKLQAMHLDPARELQERYPAIQEYLLSLVRAEGLDELLVHAVTALPITAELVALTKLVELVDSGTYDVIVLDTLPSGEALRCMYLLTLLGASATTLTNLVAPFASVAKAAEPLVGIPTPGKEVLSATIKHLEQLRRLKAILLDHAVTSLRVVANPEPISLEHAKRTVLLAKLYGLNPELLILNRVLAGSAEAGYPELWTRAHAEHLAAAEAAFRPVPVRKVSCFPPDVSARQLIAAIGAELFGAEDPAQIYFKGEPIVIRESDRGLEVIVPLPAAGACKGVCDVERVGDDLSILMATEIGDVRHFVPLTAAATPGKLQLASAKWTGGQLVIAFIKG